MNKISGKCRIKFFAKYFVFEKIEFDNLSRLIPDIPKKTLVKKHFFIFISLLEN